MSNSINTNIAAFYAQANITAANNEATSSVARLSSGNAIVEASDNVAALAIGNSLASQVAQLATAGTNASQGSSLLQVADGALAQIGSILNQQNSIALQAASGSLTNTDRGFLNQQFVALTNEINALATGTTFNGVNLIDGSIASGGGANSLQNASINTAASGITSDTTVGGVGNGDAGFSQTTNGPAYGTVNFTGFTSTSGSTPFYGVDTNGATQYGNFATSAAHNVGTFTAAGTSIAGPAAGGNDINLFGSLNTVGGGVFTSTLNTAGGVDTSYTINYTKGGVVYTGTLAATGTLGAVAAGTVVTLQNTASPSTNGTITLTVGAAFATGDNSDAGLGSISAALTQSFATATGYNPYFTNTPVITQPQGGNDLSLFGNLSSGNFTVAHTGTLTTSGGTGSSTGYTVTYNINGVTYQGTLANHTTGSAQVDAASTVTLSATTNTASHATIQLTVGVNGFGTTPEVDQGSNIQDALTSTFVGSTGFSAGFINPTANAGLTIKDPTGTTAKDSSLYGDLSNGVVSVAVNGTGIGGTSTGYTVSYTLNGVTYQGTLANDGSAGHGIVSASTALTLTATSNPTLHATINLKTGTQAFGISEGVDQSANIKAGLQAYLTGASILTTATNATVSGQVAQTGIGLVSSQNDIGKNDTALVGDLSQGIFAVTGNTTNGYSVSYALNGSTYQGSYTAAEITNGSTLVLDNGKGTLSFALTASTATTPNADLASASTLQAALTNQFSAATAYAKHEVITTNATDSNGVAIAGSAIPAVATGVLTGFSGANATLQSALFSGVNLPSVSAFSGTGSGTSTVLSVVINGKTYSTAGTVTNAGNTLQTATFNGGASGSVTFYANGDTSSNEQLTLSLGAVTGAANINTTADVTNLTTALNNAFGSGGSSGGLQFQLGTTSTSNVAVNIGSARSTALYAGLSLDISTQTGATTAAAQVNTAINTVTSLRAGVGALESQFNFAAAALQTSTQNQTAAEGQFLDTDIAAESTKYATEQVKLQAGISVLAQANQQLQALLKLIV